MAREIFARLPTPTFVAEDFLHTFHSKTSFHANGVEVSSRACWQQAIEQALSIAYRQLGKLEGVSSGARFNI